MRPFAFFVLLLVTVVAIWFGDSFAEGFAAPGMERTFAVLVIAAVAIAPAVWVLDRLGMIRKGNVELRRKPAAPQPPASQRDGGAA
ncbi:MAG: hypothetical protein EHM87_14040 [Burkholderiales bacterium]|jgi:hypothetical protein|nr:MAG: hypothetical protein EHM87_14040 [Burkholderiales bacterium]